MYAFASPSSLTHSSGVILRDSKTFFVGGRVQILAGGQEDLRNKAREGSGLDRWAECAQSSEQCCVAVGVGLKLLLSAPVSIFLRWIHQYIHTISTQVFVSSIPLRNEPPAFVFQCLLYTLSYEYYQCPSRLVSTFA